MQRAEKAIAGDFDNGCAIDLLIAAEKIVSSLYVNVNDEQIEESLTAATAHLRRCKHRLMNELQLVDEVTFELIDDGRAKRYSQLDRKEGELP